MTNPKRPTVAEMEANIDQEATWAESHYGPQVRGHLTGRGRPRKGVVVEPTHTHSLRLPDSVWSTLETKAQSAGLSLNQAANLALLEWARR